MEGQEGCYLCVRVLIEGQDGRTLLGGPFLWLEMEQGINIHSPVAEAYITAPRL